MSNNHNHLIWIDLEMTGLNPERECIIEIATIVTDKDLNLVAEGPVIAIYQPDSVLDKMDDWCTQTHTASGLTERVRNSKISAKQAQQMTLDFLKQHLPAGKSPMCGNTVSQDRRFLCRYMPELEAYFSYRHIDVSTLKELAKRWRPNLLAGFSKSGRHQALDDIRESIAELQYYREHFIQIAP